MRQARYLPEADGGVVILCKAGLIKATELNSYIRIALLDIRHKLKRRVWQLSRPDILPCFTVVNTATVDTPVRRIRLHSIVSEGRIIRETPRYKGEKPSLALKLFNCAFVLS